MFFSLALLTALRGKPPQTCQIKALGAGPSARLLRMRKARPSVSSQFINMPDTASSPRRHRHIGAHASPPLSQPPARYLPPDLNFYFYTISRSGCCMI